MKRLLIYCLAVIPLICSCRKIDSYLQTPDTQVIGHDIQASYAIAHTANIALTEMAGYHSPNVVFTRSSSGYPCTSLMIIKAEDADPFLSNKIGEITIAGLWADTTTAIFTIIFTNINFADLKYDLLGINTFPLIKEEGKIMLLYGAMDIDLNPNSDALLSLNLSSQETESEFLRANEARPTDVYVAVEEDGYFIDINNNNTLSDISDDVYTITGGGQAIEMTNASAGIFQKAMVEVEISSFCPNNPTHGYALLKKMDTSDDRIPELGTVLFEFNESCSGRAKITVATGIWISSNGKSVDFRFE
jgi:hypothetical protein